MKRTTIKQIASVVGSVAVGTVVSIGVKTHVIPVNTYEKVAVALGSCVLSGMISEKAEKYVDRQCDEVFKIIDEYKKVLDESKPKDVTISSADGEKVMTMKVDE